MDLNNLISDFSSLKISALSKSMLINKFVEDVTIGPNAKISPKKVTESPRISLSNNTKDTIDCSNLTKIKVNSYQPNHSIQTVDKVLSSMEKSRRETELESVDIHTKKVELFNQQQKYNKVQQWKHCQALKLQEIQSQENFIIQAMTQVEEESRLELEKTINRNKQRLLENERLLKEKSDEQQKLKKLHNAYIKIEQDILLVIKETDDLYKTNQEAKSELLKHDEAFKQICGNYKNLNAKIKSMKLQDIDVVAAEDILTKGKQLKNNIKTGIIEHYKQREQEAMEQVKALKHVQAAPVQQIPVVSVVQPEIQPQVVTKQETKAAGVSGHKLIISTDVEANKLIYAHYIELQTFLHNHEQSYKQLLDDQNYKQFKFDCKKAVNFPVNAISAVSTEHLRDKYNKLHSLLSGKTVQISDSRINASQHPQGLAFVTNLLAKKFVLQGDLTISSNPDAAFAYATIIVTLWNDFPLFGKLLLAHFYKECPYLVPIYFQQQEGQSDQDFYTSMGYQYKDGVIEKQDKFLKRMTGISKLYFSILISHTKRNTRGNPHCLNHGWIWFARILNREPYVDVTATVIYSFLEVAGFCMQCVYKKQFRKLIAYIIQYQIPLLKHKDSGGPLVRLEVMLQDYCKTGVLQKPQGMLSKNFW